MTDHDEHHEPGAPSAPDPAVPPRRGARRVAAVGLIGTLAATAFAVPALAGTDTDPTSTAERQDSEAVAELGDLTLDQLADELARHGLQLEIEPAFDEGGFDDDFWPEDGDSWPDDERWPEDDETWPEDDETWPDDEGESEPLASFTVDGDELDVPSSTDPEVAEQAQVIWSRFTELIPADQRQMVTGFELLPDEFGGAYVYPSETDLSKWILGMSPMEDKSELDYVLLHEFGHLLTLNASEVPPDPEGDDACDTYHTGEGCALSHSTMAEFVDRFWPEERIAEIERLAAAEDYDAFDDFYQKHKDEFVTDYAATNPAEDLAEVFAHFVLDDRPTGSTIADQKVQLLWDDPSMVELRTRIRANAGLS